VKDKFFGSLLFALSGLLLCWPTAASAQEGGEACPALDLERAEATALAFDVIVAGAVEERGAGVVIVPEYYLKGAAVSGPLALERDGRCPEAELEAGTRVLAGLVRAPGGFRWPSPDAVRLLPDDERAEELLIAPLRAATGQQAYPPAGAAGFDWMGVGIPVIGALVGLMAVGLYLMRLWHRIDPT